MNTNRAVSSLFQAFGSERNPTPADRRVLTGEIAMHRGEMLALAVLIPVTVLVGCGDGLVRLIGPVMGLILAVPVAFMLLNVLPFILPGRSSKSQWQLWFTFCFLWAVFHSQRSGVVGLVSYIWIAVGVMSLAAAGLLAWRKLMALSGEMGIRVRVGLLLVAHLFAIGLGFFYGWHLALLLGAVIAAICCWAVLNPGSQCLGPIYTITDSDDVLITLDDGPDPDDTPRLLDLLDRYDAKAIFFMIGEKVRKHPDLALEVLRRGHEIGNHTQTHPQASFWCASPRRTRQEIEACQKTLFEVTGVMPVWFRAPVGHRNLFTHPIAKENGLRVMGWNRRGFDAVERDVGKVLGRILPGLAKGDIVLLHEATPIAGKVLEEVLIAREGRRNQRTKSSVL